MLKKVICEHVGCSDIRLLVQSIDNNKIIIDTDINNISNYIDHESSCTSDVVFETEQTLKESKIYDSYLKQPIEQLKTG